MHSGRYELQGEWKTSSAGHTALATYGGKKYFLKRYSQFKMPQMGPSTKESIYRKRLEEYESFKANREKVNEVLGVIAGSGGNIMRPQHWYEDECFFIEATEFVEGLIDFKDIINMPLEEKLFVMLTAASALKAIHAQKVIHSDLKISNVLAARLPSGKKVAKIIDFDKAYFEGHAREDELGGDVLYFSPELSQAYLTLAPEHLEKLTTKSDIFSLGVIYHNYLAGKDLAERGAFPEIIGGGSYCGDALAAGATLKISDDIREPYLRALITAMLDKDPAKRPSAGEVFMAIKDKKYGSEPVVATRAPVAPPPPVREVEPVREVAPPPVVEEVRIPEGFCEPWEEHNIEFVESKFRARGFVGSEQIEEKGLKLYCFYTADGRKIKYTLSKLSMLDMCKSKTATPKSATYTPIARGIVERDGELLWEPENAEYCINMDELRNAGYTGVEKFTHENGTKGYRLVKASGAKTFATFQKLKMLEYVKKK